MFELFAICTAGAVSFALVSFLARPTSPFSLLDIPNERSLHSRPTPRSGGLGIVAGIICGYVICIAGCGIGVSWPIVLAVSLVAGISVIDDYRHVGAGIRLSVHVFAALVLVFFLGDLVPMALVLPGVIWIWPEWFGISVCLLLLVWMTNLYNFMDGMDGFAGGMAIFGFGSLGLAGWLSGEATYAIFNALVAASAAGFLFRNFPPASIFMGDVGSSALGLSAGISILWADHLGVLPLWVGILIFSPFVFDATVTLAKRLLRKERVWEAHKSHYYQRLVLLGWGHRKTVLAEYLLMTAVGITALGLLHFGSASGLAQTAAYGWGMLYVMLAFGVDFLEKKSKRNGPCASTGTS